MNSGMIVKVCGMRQPQNIKAVEETGPDWMGFICWEGSKRNVATTPSYLPIRCHRVGVFVNPSIDFIIQRASELRLNYIQLHGNETPNFCIQVHQATSLPIIKAISINTEFDIAQSMPYCDTEEIEYLLFDTKCTSVGGSGEQFDWDVLQAYDRQKPFLLSGGIGPDDAKRVKEFNHPRCIGIDINSRFETAPAMKDVEAIQQFIHEIRNP